MKKVADFTQEKQCHHPEHDPPGMIVLRPGVYEHVCPACGRKLSIVERPGPHLTRMSAHTDRTT